MPVYVALIRAINVGDTRTIPIAELKALARDIGLKTVSAPLQSANLVFRDDWEPDEIAAMLDTVLGLRLGRAPGVFIRTPQELAQILTDNPFPAGIPARVQVNFFQSRLPDSALNGICALDGEEAVVRGREIFVHYPLGFGRSDLKLPILERGTARNLKTVTKLTEVAQALEAAG